MTDIKNRLEKNSIILSVLSSEFYNRLIIDLMQSLENKKICYVTLNKPSTSLIKNFKFNRINTNNMFFIDAISSSIDKNKKLENGILISSPAALTELSIAINTVLRSKMFDLVLFDSLSTLKIYSNENIAIRFTSGVINKIRSNEFKGIFTCLEGDVKTNLIRQSSMYVDEIFNFRDMTEKLRKDRTKRIGGSLAIILLLLSSLSFLNANNNQAVGFLVSSLNAAETSITPFVFLVAVIMIISLLFYRHSITKTHSLRNVNEPMKIVDKSRLRARFKNKLHKWLIQLNQ